METLILIGTIVIGFLALVAISMLVKILVSGDYSLLLGKTEEISLSPYCAVSESPESIFEWPKQEFELIQGYSVMISAQGRVKTGRMVAMAGR